MDNILSADLIDNQQLRSSNKYGYIYITTNLINGKRYIGQHRSSVFNPQYLGSGKILSAAIKKYGRESFKCELLEFSPNKRSLDDLEKYYISKYNAVEDPMFYNLQKGGQPSSGMTGQHHSKESKEKSRNSNLGQKRSLEARQHMSENHADFNSSKNPFYNKNHTDESKELISEHNARAHKGKIWITNKIDDEQLVYPDEIIKFPNYVSGKLRKSQRKALKEIRG